jgi:tRNA-2-methylthio-N6-dimethylallyladenosine synthase
MPRYSVVTFGCQMNVHDSQRMEQVLSHAGYDRADDLDAADVIVLNTCSIREKAEQKLRSEVGRLRLLKAERPSLIIAVAGCVAQQEGERLRQTMPEVDIVLGPDNIAELPALLADVELGGGPRVRTVFDLESPAFLPFSPAAGVIPGPGGVTAFVTVMKGCNERCSYCIVPHTRGSERYRPSSEIIDECQRLVASGVREITLLGQTVNSYIDPSGRLESHAAMLHNPWARSRGSLAHADETEFPALLSAIARDVPDLYRLRYTSPHPRHLTPALMDAHARLGVLSKHVHMPVQSGSDAVLRRMLRRYSAAEYVERTDALRRALPGLTLSTDIIVGFPGETEEDFEATLALVRRVGFVAAFGFKYSVRPFTPAERLADDISEEEKSRRLARLFAEVDTFKERHLAGLIGAEATVLVEGLDKRGGLFGRSERNEIVHLSAESLTGLEVRAGSVVLVEVEQAYKNSLLGRARTVLSNPPETASIQTVSIERAEPLPTLASSEQTRRKLPVLGGAGPSI